jgi:hypothetical protein
MSSNPSPADIQKALEALALAEDKRSEEQKAFLAAFAQDHFQFGDADPSAISAELSTRPDGLFEIYFKLKTEEKRRNPAAPLSESMDNLAAVYALRDDPSPRPQAKTPPSPPKAAPKASAKRPAPAADDDDDLSRYAEEELQEEQAAAQGDAPRVPRTAAGRMLGSLEGTSHEPTDEQIGQWVSRQGDNERWKARAGFLAKASLVTALGLGAILGGRAAWQAKKAAENTGDKVQQIQDDVGNFAEQLGADPHGAAIPRSQQQDAPPTTKGQEAVGKHTNQLKQKDKNAPPATGQQKSR